jgi:hypothetical protein
MRRLFALVSLAAVLGPALAAATAPAPSLAIEKPLAVISYTFGEVSLLRDGKAVAAPDIGDPVYDDDLLKTGGASGLVLELAPSTGMRGSITLAAKSSIYLHLDLLAGQNQNSVELIAGQLGVKVKRIVGAPGFKVTTDNSVLGVRGTEFEVTSSPLGELLVTCSEGEVSCSSGEARESALPGQIVEKREGLGLARRSLASKDYAAFQKAWLAERGAAFRRDAARNVAQLVGSYLEIQARMAAASRLVAADGDLKAWAEGRRKGRTEATGEALDRAIDRVQRRIEKDRELLGAMERASARLEALQELLASEPELSRLPAAKGQNLGQFLARFGKEKTRELEKANKLRGGFKLLRLKQNLREELRLGSEAAPPRVLAAPSAAPSTAAPSAATPSPADPAASPSPAATQAARQAAQQAAPAPSGPQPPAQEPAPPPDGQAPAGEAARSAP